MQTLLSLLANYCVPKPAAKKPTFLLLLLRQLLLFAHVDQTDRPRPPTNPRNTRLKKSKSLNQ